MNAYVYFVGARWDRLRRWSFPWLCARLAVTLTRSPLLHVAVGSAEYVGSCAVGRVSLFYRDKYETLHDAMLGHFKVPVASPIHPERVLYMRPVTSIWPSLLAWATGGRSPCHNCVTVACDLLREGGIDVPRGTYSPKQLHQWLTKEGYRWVSKPPSSSADSSVPASVRPAPQARSTRTCPSPT